MNLEEIKKDFDSYVSQLVGSPTYAKICSELYGEPLIFMNLIDKEQLKLIKSLIPNNLNSEDKILDVGCGTGAFINYLYEKYKSECIGLDFVDNEVRLPEVSDNVKYVSKNIESYFPVDQKFSLITVMDALFLVQDLKSIIQEMVLHLNENGVIIIAKSQYPFSEKEKILVEQNKTLLDPILNSMSNISYQRLNVLDDEKNYWIKLNALLDKYTDSFKQEGNDVLLSQRFDECNSALEMHDAKEVSRFIYKINSSLGKPALNEAVAKPGFENALFLGM